jgi:hypothetical protein
LFRLLSTKQKAKSEVERSGARENEENFNLNKHHSAFLCEEWRILAISFSFHLLLSPSFSPLNVECREDNNMKLKEMEKN